MVSNDPATPGEALDSNTLIAMSTNENTILETLAEQYDGNLESLSREDLDRLERKATKARKFRNRGMDDRADTLKREVVSELDGIFEDESEGGDVDTLSQSAVAAKLENYGMDTLNTQWRIEEEIERLERKRATFEKRDMDDRAGEIQAEIDALEAAKSEAGSGRKYEDRDTLASRITGEQSRTDGGETVVLKESGTGRDTLSRGMELDTYEPCGFAVAGGLPLVVD